MNYYAVVFSLRPPDLLRRETLFGRKNVCNSQKNGVHTRCAGIVNHSVIANLLRVVNWLRRSIFSTAGSFGESAMVIKVNEGCSCYGKVSEPELPKIPQVRNSEKPGSGTPSVSCQRFQAPFVPRKFRVKITLVKLKEGSLRLWSRPPFTGVLRGPGLKVPHGVLFERFWSPASECPKECFLSAFWHFLAPKTAKNTRKALFGALRGRWPKLLKKHSMGHFQARAPEHSCRDRNFKGNFRGA